MPFLSYHDIVVRMMRRPERRREQLLRRRDAAVQEATKLLVVLRATLRRRYVRCGKSGCHCREGQGHGPFIYLSTSRGVGQTRQITVEPQAYDLARLYVHNYQRLWRLMEKISAINWQLLQERLLPEPLDRPAARRRAYQTG